MTNTFRRTVTSVLAAAALVAGGGVAVPLLAAAPVQTPPVQSVTLLSSQTKVTSSSGAALYVQVQSSQTPNQSTGNTVSVSLSTGSSDRSEIHEWTFPVDATAMAVADNGNGTLNVPDAKTAPYGSISLKMRPVGSPTTDSCGGAPRSRTQQLALDGTFFFDSLSKGAQKWGTVGQQVGKFTFSGTNTVTTTYLVTDPNCFNFTLPCSTSLFWDSGTEDIQLEGVASGKRGLLFGSRTTALATPAGATRHDEVFGKTKKLVLVRDGSGASLAVKSAANARGKAKITAKKHHKPASSECTKSGQSKVETSTRWTNAHYQNGGKPLTVKAQVFGKITVADNGDAQIVKTRLS
jgi:hypothetical protein